MNGYYSSRNQTANSYVLRSASKGNVSKKQGIYSKFRDRSTLVNGFKRNETVQSRIEHLQPSTNRIRQNDTSQSIIEELQPSSNRERGVKQNNEPSRLEHLQPSTSRAWQNDTARSRIEDMHPSSNRRRDAFGLSMRNSQLSPPRINQNRQNDTLRSRIEDRQPISRERQNDTLRSRIEDRQPISRERDAIGLSMRNGHMSPPRINQSRQNDTTRSRIDDLQPSSSRERNEMGFEFSPRVVLKRVERDNDGFVIPSIPKLRCEEQKRSTKKDLSELTDILPSAEAFYFIKRFEDILESSRRKVYPLLNGCTNSLLLDRERKVQIADWLQSSTSSEAPLPPVPASVISAIPREVLQDYAASVISVQTRPMLSSNQQWSKEPKAVYILRDWTIIKGRTPIEVMVSGELRDIANQTLIEDGHVSSKILNADAVVVETSCCVYHLNGDFMDSSNCIPGSVKKYFQNGKFPKEWREVIRMWSILKDKENYIQGSGHNNGTTYADTASDINDDRRSRPRENYRILELRNERNLDRMRDRGDMRQEDDESVRGRNERLPEREERIRFQEIDRLHERDDGNRRQRGDISSSYVSRKRKSVSELEEESVTIRDVKKKRTENVVKKRYGTPGVTRTSTIMTRSARKKMASAYLCTPKSSKRSLLKSRRKTPMHPHRGRILTLGTDSEVSEIAYDNSDLM